MSDFLNQYYIKKQYHDRRNQIKEQIINEIGIRGWSNLLYFCNANGLLFLIGEMLENEERFQVTNLADNLYTILGEEFLTPLIGLPACEYAIFHIYKTDVLKKELQTIIANNLNTLTHLGVYKDSNIYTLYEEYTRLGGEIGILKSKLINTATGGVGYVAYIR